MNWETIVSIGLILAAYLGAYYHSWRESWEVNQKAGMAVVLLGAIIGLYLDDFLSSGSPILPWVEPLGAVTILVGLSISWIWS